MLLRKAVNRSLQLALLSDIHARKFQTNWGNFKLILAFLAKQPAVYQLYVSKKLHLDHLIKLPGSVTLVSYPRLGLYLAKDGPIVVLNPTMNILDGQLTFNWTEGPIEDY